MSAHTIPSPVAVKAPSLTARFVRVLPGVGFLFGIGLLGKLLEHTFTRLRTAYPGVPFPHLEYVLWAILLGLAIGNTFGVAPFLRAGIATYELWLKLGIVLVGARFVLQDISGAGCCGTSAVVISDASAR